VYKLSLARLVATVSWAFFFALSWAMLLNQMPANVTAWVMWLIFLVIAVLSSAAGAPIDNSTSRRY